jgi:hypothetical protein
MSLACVIHCRSWYYMVMKLKRTSNRVAELFKNINLRQWCIERNVAYPTACRLRSCQWTTPLINENGEVYGQRPQSIKAWTEIIAYAKQQRFVLFETKEVQL